ncbi:PrsW family intramembrane metalloprotease [Oscillibacter valericigenes]|nr:PrsW family intramembrane metalloprotease [Oscillibacter valericigenes]
MYFFYMNPILIAAAVVPAVFLLMKVYRADRLEPEPTGLLLSLVLRGVFATVLAMLLEGLGSALLDGVYAENSLPYNIIMYFGIVAFSEEGAKYFLLKRRTWRSDAFNCQFDGVVYAVFVSLGFALWENLGYVAMYGLGTALVRAVTAVPGHACFGVFMGVYYGRARGYESDGDFVRSRRCRRAAVLLPALLHGAYDFIATMEDPNCEWMFLIFVLVLFTVSLRLVRRGARNDRYIDNDGPLFF